MHSSAILLPTNRETKTHFSRLFPVFILSVGAQTFALYCNLLLTRLPFISPNGQSWQYLPQETCSTPWAQRAWTSCWRGEEETCQWARRRWTMRPAQLFHESRPRGGGWSEHSFNTTCFQFSRDKRGVTFWIKSHRVGQMLKGILECLGFLFF